MKKKLLTVLIAIITLLSSIGSVSAAPATVTFTTRKLNGVNTDSAYTNYKVVKSGNLTYIGYCLNYGLKSPASGSTLKLSEEITNPGLVYIFANGYGYNWNSSLLGNNFTEDEKYYVTQLAVWLYQGKLQESKLDKNSKTAKAAITLYNAAKSYRAVDPSISIQNSGSTMTLSGDYYTSGYLTVGGNGYDNYKVTLINSGADARIITDKGQVYQSGSTLPKGTKFYVRIPKSKVNIAMNIIVKVDATGKTDKVYKYDSASNFQNVGILISTPKALSSQTNLNIPAPKGSLTIEKTDSTTGRLIAGAQIKVTDSNGKVVANFTSTTQPYVITNLTPGIYTITEVNAPSGYEKLQTTVKVTVGANASARITLKNTPKTYGVTIIKRDAETGNILPGATLVLKDSNGRTVDTWVTTNTPHSIKNLSAGTYTVRETKAPEGYVLDTTPVTFTVTLDGQTDRTIVLYNHPKTYSVGIIKKDVKTNQPLAGATLVLKDSNGKTIDTWVTTTGVHTINNLTPGEYSVTETKAPEGYILDSTPVFFVINKGENTTKTITVYNDKGTDTTTPVKISKQDATTRKELPGASLTLKDDKGNVIASWVSTDTPHYVTGLKPGTYTLIETKAPSGYGLSDEVITFTIDSDGKVDKEIIMYNSPIPNTADRNMTFIYLGFIGTISLAIFGMYKLSKQN